MDGIRGRKQRKIFFTIIFLFLIIIFSLTSYNVFSFEGTGIYKNGKKLEGFGSKRSKEEINLLTQAMKSQENVEKELVEKALDQKKIKGKYASQKIVAYSIHALEKNIKKINRMKKEGADIIPEIQRILSQREIIEEANMELQSEFKEVEMRCKNEGFSAIILERHHRMVHNHNKNIQILFNYLDKLEQLITKGALDELTETIEKIESHLEKYQVIKDPPLLSQGLPHSLKSIEAPSIKREEKTIPSISPILPSDEKEKRTLSIKTHKLSDEILNEGPVFSPTFGTGPPTPGDLAPTIDVQITQEIIDLAASLDNSPFKIYEYVRNNFDFEPYLGSRKGSLETLKQESGNDYDLATLFIALLRTSGIPARYVRGTVELPVDTAKNWLGVEDGATAGSILTTVGMEGVNIINGTGEVVAIQFKHVWVEAYIPYGNYRGIPVDQTGKMWIPMTPSFKSYNYHPGVDILTEMGFDAEAFIEDYISTYHELSPVELYMQQIVDYLASNHPEMSYEDIQRTREIAHESREILEGSLPFHILSIDTDFSEIPADKRYQVRFHLYDGGTTFIDHTANLPEIAGKRVTISYVAATEADQAVIDSYGDLYDTPPYLVNLKPVLKIDGIDVAVGSASIGMGLTHSSDIHFTTPVGDTNEIPVVSNTIIAGTYQAVGIDTGRIGAAAFMPISTEGTPTIDEWNGGRLWQTAMGYLSRIEQYDEEVARTMQMVVTKDVSEAIVEETILVTFSSGTPQTFEPTGLVVDADRCIVGPFAVNGDSSKAKQFMVLIGADGSISENRIFEDMYDQEAVSTIKILELASDAGIPIYTFDSGSIGLIYSTLNLSSSVENAIYSAVASGHEVTVPRDNITYFEWSGTGYIDMDPVTGAAGYIISGGHAGGATVDTWTAWFFSLSPITGITANIVRPAADGEYFPYNSPQLWFEVDYTLTYGGSSPPPPKTERRIFKPHWWAYPYPAGDYSFYVSADNNPPPRKFVVFEVEIDTPDGEDVVVGCDSITLEAKFTPSTPPSVTYQWDKSFCLLWCGDGTFDSPTGANTEFEGTKGGNREVKVEASNANGSTEGKKDLRVIEVKKIEASDGWFNSKEDTDGDDSTITDENTIYVKKDDSDTVSISVETDPSVSEGDLPAGWLKLQGTGLDFATQNKLSATIKRDKIGVMDVSVEPCSGYSKHFKVRVVVLGVNIDTDVNNDGSINSADDSIEEDGYGRIVAYNGNDNNGNSIPDRDEMSVAGEVDLTAANLEYMGDIPSGFKIILESSSGSGNIKVWGSMSKGTEITLPKTYIFGTDTIPATVYIEGYNPGNAMVDLVLRSDSDDEISRDKIKVTVVKIEIQDSFFRDSDEYMAKGYSGAPVAGNPDAATFYYRIEPDGFFNSFTPSEVKLLITKAGVTTRTELLANSSGENDWDWDGKNDAGDFVDADVYQIKIEVKGPHNENVESNKHELTVVEVTGVSLLSSSGTALIQNNHPVQPGGLRVYPGRPTPSGSLNDEVKVRVTLSANVPVDEMKVYLKSFDVNDPTGLINDNHDGGFLGTPAEGELSDEDPDTDGDNTVEVDFTVTMQPGDNFKIFASTNEELIDNLTDAIVEANTNNAGATTDARLQPLASDRLTVWRRVHVERDSMGAVTGNVISGNITAIVNNGGTTDVTTNQSITENPSANNRFENGRLRNGGNTFTVVSNTQGSNFTITVNNNGATTPVVGPFTLVDDDDFNSDDGANPDGDAAEDVTNPDTGLIQNSDNGADNVFAYAYVRPTYDLGGNTDVPFVLNTPDGADEGALLIATYQFANVATEDEEDFWTIYLLGAYQMQTEEDGDPDTEGATLGQVDAINGQGASVFMEAVGNELTPTAFVSNAATTAHETGHLFKGSHDPTNGYDGGLMDQSSTRTSIQFTDATLRKIRDIDHP